MKSNNKDITDSLLMDVQTYGYDYDLVDALDKIHTIYGFKRRS